MSKSAENADLIAARLALIDFYGDRAPSFASLFLASIFGLVAISAIVQAVNINMVQTRA